MKHTLHIVSLLIAILLMATPAFAGKPRAYMLGGGSTNMSGHQWRIDRNGLRSGTFGYIHNLVGVYVDGGFSALSSTVPNTNFLPGGYAAGAGVCYEHQRGMFKMQLGFGMRYQNVCNGISDSTFYDAGVTDAWGYNYNLRYDFTQRTDKCINLHAQVPILFGLGVKGYYFLSGIKLNCTFRGNSYVSAKGTTSGTYNQFLGQFYEMDNHGFRKEVDIRQTSDAKLNLKTDVLFSFETGYEFGDKMRNGVRYRRKVSFAECFEYRFRVAAFVDYSIPNICPKNDNPFLSVPEGYKWDLNKYEVNHVFSSSMAAPYQVRNFYAGVKVTVLIGAFVYKHCRLCHDFTSERDM